MTPHASNEGTPVRPELRNYQGDGSTGDYIHDMLAYADRLERENQSLARRVGELEGLLGGLIQAAATHANALQNVIIQTERATLNRGDKAP